MKKKSIAALLVLILLAPPVWAILGLGDIVHDPISYANAVLMLGELIVSYEQLKAQFELAYQMSQVVPVNMSLRYQTPSAAWLALQLQFDRFQNLAGWVRAVNTGSDAGTAYNGASVPLRSYGAAYTRLHSDEQTATASHYADVELADAANINSMQTLGTLRGNAKAVEQSIENLTADSLSLDPKMNTQIAVLNKINAASVAGLRATRDTNRALISIVEHQVVEAKRARDAQAAEINFQIMRLERGDESKAQFTSGITDSVRGFRWR